MIETSSDVSTGRRPRGARVRHSVQRLVLLALVVAAPGCELGELPAELPDAGESDNLGVAPPRPGELRVMTYNIRHAADASLAALSRIIEAESPDIVLLQEVDQRATRSGGQPQAARLGELTGLEHRFVKAISLPDGGDYGLAILSRFPILGVERVPLPSRGEKRILAIGTVELPDGRELEVANTHLGLGERERREQAEAIAAALAGRGLMALGGDLNATPGESAVHDRLAGHLEDAWGARHSRGGGTAPALFPYRRIDYLYLSRGFPRPRSVRVVGGPSVWFASDHRPVVATVRVP